MLIMDMSGIPPQQAPIIMAQAAQPSTKELYGTVGGCFLSPIATQINPENDKNGNYSLSPRSYAGNIFSRGPGMDPLFGIDYENGKVTVLQPPKYGSLSQNLSSSDQYISYYPNPSFVGNDKVVFLVNIEGYKVKVVYYIKVNAHYSSDINPDPYRTDCPYPSNWWKISQDPNGNSTLTAVDYLPSFTGNSASVTGSTLASVLSKGLSNSLLANTSGITLNIADLPGGAVGETTGTSITLDSNAAGYGWYVDPNPAANTDFLPTANPDVWMAKAGSAAAGKMDMLSVLLHEYGHALM
jgi:hypothetical protein